MQAAGKDFHDKNESAIHAATFWAPAVGEYAKKAGAGDWDAVANQNGDRPKNKLLVEKMINDFASKFSFTLISEGDDCSVEVSRYVAEPTGLASLDNALLS